jgi:hypothetical protein
MKILTMISLKISARSLFFSSASRPLPQPIVQPEAFDSAIKGVAGVVHTASPLPTNFKSNAWDDQIHPAISGAVGILKSIQQHNPNVLRVVITSSYGGAFVFSSL